MADKKGKKFLIDNPKLMAEWDWEENNKLGIYPDNLSYGSAKKVNWKCKEGHKWLADPNHRSRGRNCPICSEKQRRLTHTKTIVYKRGSLATNNSTLAKQWDYEKNKPLTPDNISNGSNKKIWWKCDKGHSWKAPVSSRQKGVGCPICSGHQVLAGYNDLATLRPDLAKEWDYEKNQITPKDITTGSEKKIWWKCDKGHSWQTTVAHRTEGNGCPECSRERRTSFPEQIIYYYFKQITTAINRYIVCNKTEIDVYLPEYNIGIEYDGLYYHKDKLSKEREIKKEKNLEKLCIKLIRVKEVSNPSDKINTTSIIYTNNIHSTNSLTKMVYDLFDLVGKVVNKPIKTNIDIDKDRNNIYELYINTSKEKSLLITNPEIASEWHPVKNGNLKPEHVTCRSTKIVWWLGKCGHEWQTKVYARKGCGCPICSSQQILVGFNDLATTNPQLASEWHPTKNSNLTPQQVTSGSNKKAWWKCNKGHEWQAVINSRNSGVSCPYCSNKKVLPGYNDLATTNPQLAIEWHPTKNGDLTPQQVTIFSNKRVWWLCSKNRQHEWQTSINSRHGCPYCSNKKVLPGYNDLATTNPQLASEWNSTKNGDLTPQEVTKGSDKKVWWKCKYGHEWQANIYGRDKGKGCPYCSGRKSKIKQNIL